MNVINRILERARGKSPLYDLHPDLRDRIPVMRAYSDGRGNLLPDGSFTESAGVYASYVWVRRAIEIITNNIGALTLNVVTGPSREAEIVEGHALSSLFQMPNPVMDSSVFWNEWVINMMLGGEFGIEIANNAASTPLEMWPRQPIDFTVGTGPNGKRYREVTRYRLDFDSDRPYDLEPSEFIHYKFPNPLNVWRGLAPIAAVRMGIKIDRYSQAWAMRFFENQARPDFALIAPEGLTKDEKDSYLDDLTQNHSGANAHRPIVLEQGVLDIKTFSHAPKDMEWLEQRKTSRDEVGAIFGIPDEVMGFGKDTYENMGAAYVALWTTTLVPLIGFRDRVATHHFKTHTNLLRPDQRIQTYLGEVSQLKEDLTNKVKHWSSLVDRRVPGAVASEFLGLGLPDYPGADEPIERVPMNTGRSVAAWQPVKRQGVSEIVNKAASVEYGSDHHKAVLKTHDDRVSEPRDEMQRIMKRYFQGQQNRVTAALRAAEQRTYGYGKHKDSGDVPDPESLFDLEAEIKLLIGEVEAVVLEAIILVASAEIAAAGIDMVFDADDPDVVAQVRLILESVARKTNDTTWLGLIDLFEEAEAAGEGIPAIMERLAAFFGDRKSDYQTERIARTTMTGASNLGGIESMAQIEAETGLTAIKTWISALLPNRTRDTHAAAHGQAVGLRDMFEVGGEALSFPGDPEASVGNIANCLCTLIYELLDEE